MESVSHRPLDDFLPARGVEDKKSRLDRTASQSQMVLPDEDITVFVKDEAHLSTSFHAYGKVAMLEENKS